MSKITITINTDNAAFEEDYVGEIQRILSKIYPTEGPVRDSNGNTVGEVTIDDTDGKQEKLEFVNKFAEILAGEGEVFFTSGDINKDYELIKGTIDQQGYWAGTKYRYFFDEDYKLKHLETRRFGQ